MKKYLKNSIKAIMITFAVFLIHYLSDIMGVEALAMNGFYGWVILFMFYTLGLFLALMGISYMSY